MRDDSVQSSEVRQRADADRISRDMEGIFGAPAASRPAKRKIGSDPVETIVVQRPRRARKPSIGTPALLGFGAVIGGVVAWLVLPSSQAAPNAVHRPAPAQYAGAVEQAQMIPPAPAQQVAPVRAASLAVPVSIVPAFASQAGGDTPVDNTPIARPKRPTLTRAAYRPARQHKRRTASAAEPRAPCENTQGLWRARCMRPQILAADRRLRDAYDGAVRAGVDRRMLVAYRNRWNRLRDDAVSDPSHVTVSFQQMAQRLDAARAEAADF